jgi:hypothetical protein
VIGLACEKQQPPPLGLRFFVAKLKTEIAPKNSVSLPIESTVANSPLPKIKKMEGA